MLIEYMYIDTEHRIIGGRFIDITDRPFQVLITQHLRNGKILLICGGALISSRWVLTAAQLYY